MTAPTPRRADRRRRRRWLVTGALALLLLAGITLALRLRPPALREPDSVADLAGRIDAVIRAGRADGTVPAVAVAIVHGGRVAWSRTYGATADDRFQVGSISKPVAALGVLRLAQSGAVSLDARVRIRGWTTPTGLTLRRLLSHTAGLTPSGYVGTGRPGPLADVTAELEGRGDGPAVRQIEPPGKALRYSGGGYTVAQAWTEQHADAPFASALRARVLLPLRMDDSTFEQEVIPPGALHGHDARGQPLPDRRYPSLAAAGLWSTASDIGRFVAWAASDDPLARRMRRPAPATDGRWGLGLELQPLRDGRTAIEHEGINVGWHSRFLAEPRSGWGVVVLTDSDAGGDLADGAIAELVR